MSTRDGYSRDPSGAPRSAARRELDLFDLIALLWTQKLFAILIAVLVFIPLSVLAWVSLTPTYEASSRLLVILDDTDLTPGAAGSGGAFTLDQVMESEAEILNSDAVRRRAIEAQGGMASPLQLRSLRQGFSVARSPNASVLSAQFEADDPTVAANTLNAIIDAYLAYRVELLVGGAEGGLQGRLDAAEQAVAAAEADYRAFLADHGLSDFETEQAALLQRLADLQGRLLAARAEADQARTFARTLEARLANIPDTIELYVENSVSGQLLDLQVRRTELLARYQPDAPPVQALEREIGALEAFIAAGGADGRGQRRTGVNPVWQELEGERLRQEAFAASQGRLASALQAQLDAGRTEASRLRALSPDHDRLVRAVEARADAADRLSVQAADASARREAPPGAADAVRIVERATPPAEASSLRKPAVLAVAVFAAGLGVLAALLRGFFQTVRSSPGAAPPPAAQTGPASSGAAAPAPAHAPSRPAAPLKVLARVPDYGASAAR